VVAVISLSSIRSFTDESYNFLNSIYDTLNARVDGILVFRTTKHLLRQLEEQNMELEAQKNLLATQSAELTQQNAELEMQKNLLSEASRLKTNFLSNMSHELRTPLNSVIALSGVLSRRLNKKIPADEYSYLDVIERNGKHLLSLINDILDISRIESGREEVEIVSFNVDNLITDITEMIRPQAKQKKIELVQRNSTNELNITSDSHKFRHIMLNLIGNALKFTEKGKVEIDVTQESGSIHIRVSDTGIGIAEQHLEHIFDEFRQADGSTSRRFGGTGLGLAIARKYAHLLGGDITVKSQAGKGSVFTLSLPITYTGEQKSTEDWPIQFKPTLPQLVSTSVAGKAILLVEDSEPAIIQLKDFMEEYGCQVLVAHNAKEALSMMDQTLPDAIILDLMMPDVDGFELLGTIRHAEKTAALPVLILTAKHITKEELQFLKRNNVHQLIQKGDVNPTELLNAVAAMVAPSHHNTNQEINKPQALSGKPLVLVVEDNVDNMLTVKALLDDKFTVLEAVNGQEGIDCAKKYLPHLILMDLALPGINGIEAFQKIRNDAQLEHIPIIALTASAMTSERVVILAHGFDGYIAKPIDDKVFFGVINKVLFGK
jgi:signal transduction histidine kinase/DNA-binding response OmpR family regulator